MADPQTGTATSEAIAAAPAIRFTLAYVIALSHRSAILAHRGSAGKAVVDQAEIS
jgi:hypothetical protein